MATIENKMSNVNMGWCLFVRACVGAWVGVFCGGGGILSVFFSVFVFVCLFDYFVCV